MRDAKCSTRRRILTALPAAALAAVVARPAVAEEACEKPAAPQLLRLIEAHRQAYAALMERLHSPVDPFHRRTADRIEQETLSAVCAFPARSEPDLRAKARYLLEIEERGELDLPQHIQAVLRSMT